MPSPVLLCTPSFRATQTSKFDRYDSGRLDVLCYVVRLQLSRGTTRAVTCDQTNDGHELKGRPAVALTHSAQLRRQAGSTHHSMLQGTGYCRLVLWSMPRLAQGATTDAPAYR